MTWFVSHGEKYKHSIKEIPKQRDRGAAIVATAILEEHLLMAIQSRIQRHDHTEKKMLSNAGPLSSFSSRIDFGLLLGLYPEQVQRRLHLIRKIRNNFAHNMHPTSFKSQSAECTKFNAPKGAHRRWNKLFDPVFVGDSRSRATMTMFRSSTNPRTQFVRAVQQLCAHLSLTIILNQMNGPWEKKDRHAPQPSRDK
jgi:hypothetical protein